MAFMSPSYGAGVVILTLGLAIFALWPRPLPLPPPPPPTRLLFTENGVSSTATFFFACPSNLLAPQLHPCASSPNLLPAHHHTLLLYLDSAAPRAVKVELFSGSRPLAVCIRELPQRGWWRPPPPMDCFSGGWLEDGAFPATALRVTVEPPGPLEGTAVISRGPQQTPALRRLALALLALAIGAAACGGACICGAFTFAWRAGRAPRAKPGKPHL